MQFKKLPNYLRMHRKRSGFNQKEIAHLLGHKDGTSVCRNELCASVPNLKTALAFEAIYQVPISELFPGMYEDIQQEVSQRADELIVIMCDTGSPRLNEKRYRKLNLIIESCLPVID